MCPLTHALFDLLHASRLAELNGETWAAKQQLLLEQARQESRAATEREKQATKAAADAMATVEEVMSLVQLSLCRKCKGNNSVGLLVSTGRRCGAAVVPRAALGGNHTCSFAMLL